MNLVQKNSKEKLFFQAVSQIETHLVTITPKTAEKLLEMSDSKHQRKINQKHVTFLAREMEKGNFVFNGDSIRQDSEGNIIDGQHRLAACVLSGVQFNTLFVKGLDTNQISTINTGQRIRSYADVLEITHKKKYKYANQISAAVRMIIKLQHNHLNLSGAKDTNSHTSSTDFLEFCDKHPHIFDFVENEMRIYANGDKLIVAKLYLSLKWQLQKLNQRAADKFFQLLSDGIGLNVDHPIYKLRKKLINYKLKKSRLTTKDIILSIYRTWNAFMNDELISRIYTADDIKLSTKYKNQLW